MRVNGFFLDMSQYLYLYVGSFHPQLKYPNHDGIAEVVFNDTHTILNVSWSCRSDVGVAFSNTCLLTIVMLAPAGSAT